ncbi:hypothetical protein AAFC00_004889 [Neodothiora populina]|uniref:RraA-like protein n=1 Tax=Neodothiora populina TaxID=2781224 RepID=A0ABR3P3J1_9PEZI
MDEAFSRQVRELASGEYSACDISDCLLKLKVPGAGFLPDIVPLPISSFPQSQAQDPTTAITVAPISTVLFTPLHCPPSSSSPEEPNPGPEASTKSNISPETHWTDLPTPHSICVIQQPPNQSCAVVGDILATRLKLRGVRGVVVDGRVRDLRALGRWSCGSSTTQRGGDGEGEEGGKRDEDEGFVVWSKGTSTVGSGLQAKAFAVGVRLRIGVVGVDEGDILFADASERGVVVIPRNRLSELLEMLPAVKAADDAVFADVEAGVSVQEAFRRHR